MSGLSLVTRQALLKERCNGCGLPRREWGPVCSGMTQGDYTHYHSAAYWLAKNRNDGKRQ